MSWFKRLSIAKRVSLNNDRMPVSSNDPACDKSTVDNSGGSCLSSSSMQCSECTKLTVTGSNNDDHTEVDPTMASTSGSCYINPQLVDPEEFFDDPYHVKMYRDEREFLDMISEYVIVEDPNKRKDEGNFFSADFEAEYINFNRSTSTGSIILEDQFCIYEKSDPEHNNNNTIISDSSGVRRVGNNLNAYICDEEGGGDYKFFWGHWIKPGCMPNHLICPDNTVNKTGEKRPSTTTPKMQSAKRKRTRSRTQAFQHSIMSALQKSSADTTEEPTYEYESSDSINSFSDSQNGCEPDQLCTLCTDDTDRANRRDDEDIDVEILFGLDDKGNIILDMNHIHEEKGYGFLMCRTKKLYRSIPKGEEVDEKTINGKRLLGFLKDLTRCLCILFACGHPRNKSQYGGPEDTVRAYTLQLASDHSSTFSQNIENFIACTKESREPAPQVVMRNMRQFMNGMKNYLVKHGEGDFHQEVQKARSHLKSDEFLNLDAILEAVMHQLVVLPLREHLYGLFVDYYTRTGDIQLLVQNVKYACARNAPEFGIRPSVAPPSSSALAQIGVLLTRLQEAELPLEKLELFLCVISAIFDATGCPRGQQLGADDFLPILVYVVAKCGFVGAEIEAEYMWGLLQPALLNGEAGYYLTALCSAVHVLKSFIGTDNESGTGSLDWRSSSLPACSSVLRVIIPDECNGSLQTRTLPVRPHTTTRDVCRIIAHKARITNPQDYGLFKLVDGEETLLVENECPQDARIAARGKHCMLAYKRLDAKIAWPPTATSA